MTESEISREFVEAAIEVHRTPGGPGLLESVYEEALVRERCRRGLHAERQVILPRPCGGRTLASLRDPLPPGLLSGKIEVAEADSAVEEVR